MKERVSEWASARMSAYVGVSKRVRATSHRAAWRMRLVALVCVVCECLRLCVVCE